MNPLDHRPQDPDLNRQPEAGERVDPVARAAGEAAAAGIGAPHRRHSLQLHLEADTLELLAERFVEVAQDFELDPELVLEHVSGSSTDGHWLVVRIDEAVTAESHREALRTWRRDRVLARREAAARAGR